MTDFVDLGYSNLLLYGSEENDLPLSSLTDSLAEGSSSSVGTASSTMNTNPTTDIVDPASIDSGDVNAQLTVGPFGHIKGGQTAYNTGAGFFLGWSSAAYKFSIGDSSANYLTWDGTTLTISGTFSASAGTIGGFDIGADYIRDVANSFGLASTVSGSDDVRFWAGDTFANRATAVFRVTEAGAVTASSITITGGSVAVSTLNGTIALGNLDVAAQGWSNTCAFTVTDADTIAWGSGTFRTAAGTSYSISAGNTGNMVAKTYVYLDTNVSTTVYQTTTTAATAVGAGKALVGIAQNGTGEATFTVMSGQGGQNIDASSIVANSITANELSTSIIYAGVITIDTAGNIHSGQTSYNTGTGWFLGNVTGTAKFSIGDGSANFLTWDGTTLATSGKVVSQQSFTTGIAVDAGSAAAIESDGLLYRTRATAFSTTNTEQTLSTAGANAYLGQNRLLNVTSTIRALFYSPTGSGVGSNFILKQIAISPTASTISSVTSTTLDTTVDARNGYDAVMVTSSDAAVAWSGPTAIRARYVSGVDATVSLGTSISIVGVATKPCVVKVSSTEFLVIYAQGGDLKATSVSISGTTLTAGSTYTILANGNTNSLQFAERFGTSTAYALTFNDTTSTKPYIMAFTFSGTTLTAGTPVHVVNHSGTAFDIVMKSSYLASATSTQMGVIARFDVTSAGGGGDSVYLYTYNLSGTTLTLGVQVVVENVGAVLANSNQVTLNKISTYTYAIGYADSTTTTVGGLYRLASDTFSVLGSELAHTGITADTAIPNIFCYYSPTRILMVGTSSTSANGFAKTVDFTTNYNGTIGVITSAAALSASALTILNGENTSVSGLTVGTEYYADLDGALTTAALGGTKRIGVAGTTTSKIIVQV